MKPTTQYHRLVKVILLDAAVLSTLFSNPGLAQILPDATLGNESSLLTPNININKIPSDRVDGGAIRGANLFHSFQEFNINEERGVYFANPSQIENILARVTGANPSQILGTLGVLGNANLFIINPNGVLFGPNARLDLDGSFLASTASSLIFNNGFEFSTNNPQSPPLLTVDIPIGLRFRENPGSIVNRSQAPATPSGQSRGLLVPLGQNLALIGGDVNLEGGSLLAPSGQIELGGLLETGIINLKNNNNSWRLLYPDNATRGNVALTNDATVFVGGIGGGNIRINARNLDVLEKSQIVAGILNDRGSNETKVGDIEINVTDTIRVDNSLISNTIPDRAVGNAGNIVINTGSLSITNTGLISSIVSGTGNTGKISILAREGVSLSGSAGENNSAIVNTVAENAVGNAGDIEIIAKSLSITDGAAIATGTLGKGNAGNVNIQASDSILISGAAPTGIHTDSLSTRSLQAGDIQISASSFSLSNGAQLTTTVSGDGDAGNINIQAKEVNFNGEGSFLTGAFTIAFGENPSLGLAATGKAGNISITAESIFLTNGTVLATFSNTKKGAGNIQVNARDRVSVNGGTTLLTSGIASVNSGNIIINAGGTVSFDGVGKAYSGFQIPSNINDPFFGLTAILNGATPTVVSTGVVNLRAEISTTIGQGGNIEITAGSVSVTNGAFLSTTTLGTGNAGNITIKANDTVSFDGAAPISSAATLPEAGSIAPGRTIRTPSGVSSDVGAVGGIVGSGRGGDIVIEARSLSITGGAQVSTLTGGKGDAGNIIINTSDRVDIDKSDRTLPNPSGLFSTTEQGATGKGGEIIINTANLQVADSAILTARTRSASQGGNINVQVNNLELNNGGQLITTAFSSGNAGNIAIHASDRVTISGTATSNIFLANDTPNSGIFVRSQQTEAGAGDAGTININAPTLILDNQGTLTGASASVNGGNILLQTPDLLVMRRNSSISASAGTALAGGNGGNVNISSDILAALENSDITANAFQGDGGRVNVTAQSIFGAEFRLGETSQSDITASSIFGRQGEVILNIADVDASRGLAELPELIVDPDSLIAQNACTLGKRSQFVEIGRGGLPASPSETLTSDAVRVSLVDPVSRNEINANARMQKPSTRPNTTEAIVPARSLIINDKGEIILTAESTNMGNQRPWQTSAVCNHNY